ncbi:hypothetical protein SNE40_012676 [Patella caerulea]|uniref:Fibrinogen C-terminal domain-containing protein n=1 Tax=Patella caerulea TaxID=87958 RepID=A0AAN8JM75_PATCE
MKWGRRRIILRHFSPAYTLNRLWVQYVDGFDHGIAATWIGLEKLYWLSGIKTLDLYIQFQKRKAPDEYVKVVYVNFEIGDWSTNYQLLSAQMNDAKSDVNVTDCLSRLIGSSFSSYDMDPVWTVLLNMEVPGGIIAHATIPMAVEHGSMTRYFGSPLIGL